MSVLLFVWFAGCATHPKELGEHPARTDHESEWDEQETEDGGSDDGGSDDGSSDDGSSADGGVDDGGSEDESTVEDAAEMVWVDLPSDLTCGAGYSASIEVRNTGTAVWTRDGGYKLGAVGDEDALYSPDTRVWLAEDEVVVPGNTHIFEIPLTAPGESGVVVTDWQMVREGVHWFGESALETVAVTCGTATFCDPLTASGTHEGYGEKLVEGGSFTAAGWQTTGEDDQLRLMLSTPVSGAGSLEVDVTNFDPSTQYTATKTQIINMYTTENGSQDVFDTDEAWWNIRTGTNYGTGLKFLAAPNGGDSREEGRYLEDDTWDPDDVHRFRVEWSAGVVDLFLNGTHLETFPYGGRVQPLQYVFLGRDNVYGAQVGPVYSNLCVTGPH